MPNDTEVVVTVNAEEKAELWKQRFFEAQASFESFVAQSAGFAGFDVWISHNAQLTATLLAGQVADAPLRLEHFAKRLTRQLKCYESDIDLHRQSAGTYLIDNRQCGILQYRRRAEARGVKLTFDSPCHYCRKLNTKIAQNYIGEVSIEATLREDGCQWRITDGVADGALRKERPHSRTSRTHPALASFPDFYDTAPTHSDSSERQERYNADLVRLWALFELPYENLKTIVVAGTNGKGSTSTLIAEVLQRAGYVVGTITTPAVAHVTEIIKVDGIPISREELDYYVDLIVKRTSFSASIFEDALPTQYALLVVAANLYFRERMVDIVVAETAMGGLFDPTTPPNAIMAIFTSISLDHTDKLGSTIAAIAKNKSGVIRPGCDVIVAPQCDEVAYDILQSEADRIKATLTRVSLNGVRWLPQSDGQRVGTSFECLPYRAVEQVIPLLGSYQVENVATALCAVDVLTRRGTFTVRPSHIDQALANFKMPGRIEILSDSPLVIADGAHNVAGITALLQSLQAYFPSHGYRFVTGMGKDKEVSQHLRLLSEVGERVYATRSSHPRSWTRQMAGESDGTFDWFEDPIAALQAARRDLDPAKELICITGSLYLLGDFQHREREMKSIIADGRAP